mmetsp:Transcript_6521/g.15058  ORF Transcript_6521/g.15058 Transcript_6521/m.15058 type:complete len:744 (+) Transcript_6521:316-2547(+)
MTRLSLLVPIAILLLAAIGVTSAQNLFQMPGDGEDAIEHVVDSNPLYYSNATTTAGLEPLEEVVGILFNIRSKLTDGATIQITGLEFLSSLEGTVFYQLSAKKGPYYVKEAGVLDGPEGMHPVGSYGMISSGLQLSAGECSSTIRQDAALTCPLTIVPREDFFPKEEEPLSWSLVGPNSTLSIYLTMASANLLVRRSAASSPQFDSEVIARTPELEIYEGLGFNTFPYFSSKDSYSDAPVSFVGRIVYKVVSSESDSRVDNQAVTPATYQSVPPTVSPTATTSASVPPTATPSKMAADAPPTATPSKPSSVYLSNFLIWGTIKPTTPFPTETSYPTMDTGRPTDSPAPPSTSIPSHSPSQEPTLTRHPPTYAPTQEENASRPKCRPGRPCLPDPEPPKSLTPTESPIISSPGTTTIEMLAYLEGVPARLLEDREEKKFKEIILDFLKMDNTLQDNGVNVHRIKLYHNYMLQEEETRQRIRGGDAKKDVGRPERRKVSSSGYTYNYGDAGRDFVPRFHPALCVMARFETLTRLPHEVAAFFVWKELTDHEMELKKIFERDSFFVSYYKALTNITFQVKDGFTKPPTVSPTIRFVMSEENEIQSESTAKGLGVFTLVGIAVGVLWIFLTCCSIQIILKNRNETKAKSELAKLATNQEQAGQVVQKSPGVMVSVRSILRRASSVQSGPDLNISVLRRTSIFSHIRRRLSSQLDSDQASASGEEEDEEDEVPRLFKVNFSASDKEIT